MRIVSGRTLKPHCAEENGTMERAYRTIREALEGKELTNLLQARDVLAKVVQWYNEERLQSALGYLPPKVYHQCNPRERHEERRRRMAEARQRRKERNLELRQPTIPFAEEPPVASL